MLTSLGLISASDNNTEWHWTPICWEKDKICSNNAHPTTWKLCRQPLILPVIKSRMVVQNWAENLQQLQTEHWLFSQVSLLFLKVSSRLGKKEKKEKKHQNTPNLAYFCWKKENITNVSTSLHNGYSFPRLKQSCAVGCYKFSITNSKGFSSSIWL